MRFLPSWLFSLQPPIPSPQSIKCIAELGQRIRVSQLWRHIRIFWWTFKKLPKPEFTSESWIYLVWGETLVLFYFILFFPLILQAMVILMCMVSVVKTIFIIVLKYNFFTHSMSIQWSPGAS